MTACKVRRCPEEALAGSQFCNDHVSVPDEMINRASIPSAAALLKRAARRGLISPTSEYATLA